MSENEVEVEDGAGSEAKPKFDKRVDRVSVTSLDREHLKSRMEESGVPFDDIEPYLDEIYKQISQQYVSDVVNLDFTDDNTALAHIRKIKQVVDREMTGKSFLDVDPVMLELSELCAEVFND